MMKHDKLWTPTLSRRGFLQSLGASALGLGLGGAGRLVRAATDDRYWRFAVISDPHIIDEFYEGPEGSPLDTATIFQTSARLAAARDAVNALDPAVDHVFVPGDFIHNYPSRDWDFYFQNTTRIDNAKALIDGFSMPVHVGFGNHDYDIGDITREFTHELFAAKLGIEPYYAIDHRGWKFIHANNFLGDTMDPTSPAYNTTIGSFGETQLDWLEAQLEQNVPTVIFMHYPLPIIKPREIADRDFFGVLRQYRDTIKMVITGHMHIWLQFADAFGPLTYSMGSTRYNKDAFFLVEVDTLTTNYRVLNWDQIRWGTYWTDSYEEKKT